MLNNKNLRIFIYISILVHIVGGIWFYHNQAQKKLETTKTKLALDSENLEQEKIEPEKIKKPEEKSSSKPKTSLKRMIKKTESLKTYRPKKKNLKFNEQAKKITPTMIKPEPVLKTLNQAPEIVFKKPKKEVKAQPEIKPVEIKPVDEKAKAAELKVKPIEIKTKVAATNIKAAEVKPKEVEVKTKVAETKVKPTETKAKTEEVKPKAAEKEKEEKLLKKPLEKSSKPSFKNFSELKSSNAPIRYPLEARKKAFEGQVSIIYFVTKDGLVDKIQLKKSSGHKLLDNHVLKTVARYEFDPNQQTWVNHQVEFKLEGEELNQLKLRRKK